VALLEAGDTAVDGSDSYYTRSPSESGYCFGSCAPPPANQPGVRYIRNPSDYGHTFGMNAVCSLTMPAREKNPFPFSNRHGRKDEKPEKVRISAYFAKNVFPRPRETGIDGPRGPLPATPGYDGVSAAGKRPERISRQSAFRLQDGTHRGPAGTQSGNPRSSDKGTDPWRQTHRRL
jgi:hypothetical protein